MKSTTSNKSFTGIGFNICPICGVRHNEVVLLDTRMRDTLSRDNFLGWETCPEHQQKLDEGFIALIECSNQPTNFADADRTGNYMMVRASVWEHIFNVPPPSQGIGFCPPEVTKQLQAMMSIES